MVLERVLERVLEKVLEWVVKETTGGRGVPWFVLAWS